MVSFSLRILVWSRPESVIRVESDAIPAASADASQCDIPVQFKSPFHWSVKGPGRWHLTWFQIAGYSGEWSLADRRRVVTCCVLGSIQAVSPMLRRTGSLSPRVTGPAARVTQFDVKVCPKSGQPFQVYRVTVARCNLRVSRSPAGHFSHQCSVGIGPGHR